MTLGVIVSVNLILTYNLFQNNKGPYNAQLRYLVFGLLQKLKKSILHLFLSKLQFPNWSQKVGE